MKVTSTNLNPKSIQPIPHNANCVFTVEVSGITQQIFSTLEKAREYALSQEDCEIIKFEVDGPGFEEIQINDA